MKMNLLGYTYKIYNSGYKTEMINKQCNAGDPLETSGVPTFILLCTECCDSNCPYTTRAISCLTSFCASTNYCLCHADFKSGQCAQTHTTSITTKSCVRKSRRSSSVFT